MASTDGGGRAADGEDGAGVALAAEGKDQPLLEVVKGNPTPAEFAALVAVISAKRGAGQGPAPADEGGRTAPRWAAYWRRAHQPLRPGHGAWRASALPRR